MKGYTRTQWRDHGDAAMYKEAAAKVAITATEHQVDQEQQNNKTHEDDDIRENKDNNLSKK